jgi:hypothetical protein
VKRTSFFITLLAAAVALLATSCGKSDSIKSLFLTSPGANNDGFWNLAGADSTLQLKAYAVYNSGKQIDVTTMSTWTVTVVGVDQFGAILPPYGPTTVPINTSGLMTAVDPNLCTWTDAINNTVTPPAPWNPPVWEYTGYYQVSATYRGFTSQPIAVGVGSEASKNSPVGGCGPA